MYNINPFTADPVKALHFAMVVQPTIFNFWHSDALALRTECQSVRMAKIKNGGLDQYSAEPFEQQQFGTADVEGVKMGWRLMTVTYLHGEQRGFAAYMSVSVRPSAAILSR